jgi:predicted small lipoprotein YifL
MPQVFRRPLLLSILLSLAACATGPLKPVPVDGRMTACVEPRSQICTMDYTPVCAELKSGELKTYSNACSACADLNVVSHRPAACE